MYFNFVHILCIQYTFIDPSIIISSIPRLEYYAGISHKVCFDNDSRKCDINAFYKPDGWYTLPKHDYAQPRVSTEHDCHSSRNIIQW